MVKPTLGFLSIASIAAIGALAACGTSSTGNGNSPGAASCTGTVTVATELPTSGSDASDGMPTLQGAQLAVSQANANHLLGGSCTFTEVDKDDASVALGKHDPNQGAANMTALAGNAAIVGVVGPFNSNVCEAEQPIANAADLAQITPSCTNPGLTIAGSNSSINTLSLRPSGKITFFRVCATDIAQGAADAQFATQTLNSKKAFVFDDQETYGQGLAATFTTDYAKDGGTVVGHASLPGTTRDFSTQLHTAKSDGADLIFFGGTSSNGGGILRSQMSAAGLGSSVNFLGGDGIQDTEFTGDAGSGGNGAYSTIAAPNVSQLSSATTFVSAYQAKYNAAPGAYSANAYDAMNIILQAVKQVVTANGGTIPASPTGFRESVRAAIAAISYSGAIGTTAFDANGDTTNGLITVWQVQNGKWTWVKNVTASAS
jgi:branched-chain amino acid transport system substrate-binding protein